MDRRIAQWVAPFRDKTAYPPDLTSRRPGPECEAEHPVGYTCTRLPGHTGRHAAGAGDYVVAVWP